MRYILIILGCIIMGFFATRKRFRRPEVVVETPLEEVFNDIKILHPRLFRYADREKESCEIETLLMNVYTEKIANIVIKDIEEDLQNFTLDKPYHFEQLLIFKGKLFSQSYDKIVQHFQNYNECECIPSLTDDMVFLTFRQREMVNEA